MAVVSREGWMCSEFKFWNETYMLALEALQQVATGFVFLPLNTSTKQLIQFLNTIVNITQI